MTETETPKLAADDVAALKLADTVTINYFEGQPFIRAFLDGGYADKPRIFTAKEQRLFPHADGRERIRKITVGGNAKGYDADGTTHWTTAYGNEKHAYGYHYIGAAQYTETWASIVSLLSVGSSVTFLWRASNNNGYLKEAGLFRDELRVTVDNGKRKLTLLVAVSVTPDNSARMVKRFGP